MHVNASVKAYPPGGPRDSDIGLSDHTDFSDYSNSLWHISDIKTCRNRDPLGADSDSESLWQGGTHFSVS